MQNPTIQPPAPPVSLLQATEQAFALASQGLLSVIDLFSVTQRLTDVEQPDITIQLYRIWLEHTTSQIAYAVQFNLGVMLSNSNDDTGAEEAYRAAIAQKPNFIEGLLNLGLLLERTERFEEALAMWRTVLTFVNLKIPTDCAFYVQALNNLGRLLEICQELPEAEVMLSRSLKQDPNQSDVMTHWVYLRQKLCEWPVYNSKSLGIEKKKMLVGTSVQVMLNACDDPALQLEAAYRYVNKNVLKDVTYLSSKQSYGHKRLRIGYLSSDFCSHAVSISTAELYGLHDRSRFEVFGFYWSHEDGSPLRTRPISGMDHHIKIGTLSDEEAAKLIRSHEVDILVDLHGLAPGTRHNILSYRPAPVQITWLGFPGSTALPEIDYVLSDPFVLPPELEPFFTEKPLHMPHTFQINDRQRIIGSRPTRESCGLPEDTFVFCSFTDNFKFTPDVFSSWMSILKRVPNSILWLVSDNGSARENLCEHAKKHGIMRVRLYFAERVAPAGYLARLQLADLFLDTFPFGAGATASDALWAGLPLLTCTGRTFASRMTGSLLKAVDLPELITYDLKDYEDKAVELAEHPERIATMKQLLNDNRPNCTLFETPRFVRDLEEVFLQVACKDVDSQPAMQIESSESSAGNQVSMSIRLNNEDIPLKNALVVYTVLLGDKEPLGDPLINLPPGSDTDINIDFICFTDNHSLKSDTWKFEYIDNAHLPADKLSRRPKTLPHEYLTQYDTSLYIDNIVTFKRLPNSHDLVTSNSYLFRVFLHGNRESLFHEADAIALLGYENIDVICTQLDFYAQLCPIDTITPISTCTIILRTHHHPKLVEFGITWWEQILSFSKRDQLSFDFTVLQTGCRIDYLDGLMSDNDLVHNTQNMSDRRVKASFDSVRYAWINRHDPAAKRNPKAHFLANDSASSSDYMRRSALFDYICHKVGSSLGSYIAPRRAVAGTLNEILLPYRKSNGNMLLVQIQDDKLPLSFFEEEFHPAESAFCLMLNNYSASRINLNTDLSDLSFMSAELKYDALVLFGLPPDCCYSFIEKCASILNSSGGLIVAVMAGEGDLALIKNTQNLICSRFATECKVSVSHSSHDDFDSLISNSLICFEWKTVLVTE